MIEFRLQFDPRTMFSHVPSKGRRDFRAERTQKIERRNRTKRFIPKYKQVVRVQETVERKEFRIFMLSLLPAPLVLVGNELAEELVCLNSPH